MGDLKPLCDRLRRHAQDFRLTESEPEQAGNIAFDLDLAAEAITCLVVEYCNLRQQADQAGAGCPS